MNPQALLAALQLADSFFPSGLFTQSHGLERFVEVGLTNEDQLQRLFHAYLLYAAAKADTLAVRLVCRAAQANLLLEVQAIDQRLEAVKLAYEPRMASRRCGGRVLLLGVDLFPGTILEHYAALVKSGEAPGHQAVAVGLLAAAAGLQEEEAALIDLHTITVSLLGAAVRLGALDHRAAQRLLLALQPVLIQAAAVGRERDWQQIGGFAPEIELMQIQHQYALNHMFVS